MGLRIFVHSQTPEGFPIAEVYCRVVEFTYRLVRGDTFHVCIRVEYHLNRDFRMAGLLPVRIPSLSDVLVYECPFETLPLIYARIANTLRDGGFVVEDIDPDPVPPPAPEPTPTEAPTEAPTEPTPTEATTEPPAE